MESDYDRKFEEMKKYIPFLETMISRLESAKSGSGNPRLAQLAKIRSLRDLLLDKRKRMKMENLMKCEQVLVNLYAKIEQRDSFLESTDIQNPDLDLVRNKLKKVTARLQDSKTLPEIAGPTRSEEVTLGSKEPALFQRRQNNDLSPARPSIADREQTPSSTLHKRNYTRVLVSPDRETKTWPTDTTKRSPNRFSKKSPRKTTSFHNKRDRKKSSSQSKQSTAQLKDLNITLKVPEESLNSLNTKDILSRIINCSDNDVDIDTLRGLRSQILSELKQTGAKDDISDLILESYKRKKKSGSKKKKNKEFEEGELSDSESEIIESIYGSLVVVDKDQENTSNNEKVDEKDELPRKIQICLVINSEKESQKETSSTNDLSKKSSLIDLSDFESYQNNDTNAKVVEPGTEKKKTTACNKQLQQHKDDSQNTSSVCEVNKKYEEILKKSDKKSDLSKDNNGTKEDAKNNTSVSNSESQISTTDLPINSEPNSTKAGSCEDSPSEVPKPIPNKSSTITSNEKANEVIPAQSKSHENLIQVQDTTEIPLLDLEGNAKQEVVQEIDILQALKKEILSEKISMPDSETNTPPLHQPKVTKVANMDKILPKKRISIEKYKEKSTSAPQTSQCPSESNNTSKDELQKKQSLKLTEKECERFNLSTNVSLAETSDEEEKEKPSPSIEDIYSCLAPKSPDHEDFADTGIKPPIIIPAEPVKADVVPSKSDVDMRMLPLKPQSKLLTENNVHIVKSKKEMEINKKEKVLPLADPRVRRDFGNLNVETANISSTQHISRTPANFSPNMTPNRIQKMTLNAMSGITQANVIPNVINNTSTTTCYEMTPSRQSFDGDSFTKDHVYAPIFPVLEPNSISDVDGQNPSNFSRLRDDSCNNLNLNSNDIQKSFYVENSFIPSECPQTPNHSFGRLDMPMTPIHAFGRTEIPMAPAHPFASSDCSPSPNYTFGRTDCPSTSSFLFPRTDGSSTPSHSYGRTDCPSTPSHPFGRTDCPSTPSHPFGRTDCSPAPSHPYGRTDCASTPSHPFGRSDCPSTPNHSFGRSDFPPTPNHPFGRSDCPPTPNHPFGRSDCPPTPNHPFGRSDCPRTPNHPFGRSECPLTPNHPFGRSDCPPTPNHPFGRSDCPPTPNHPFGRLDCPPTPNHPFGRLDCPPTPNHPFGRSDCPSTPNHPFGRSDCPPTPSHPFGRKDCPPVSNRPFGRKEHSMTPNHAFNRGDFSQNQSTRGIRYNKFQNSRNNRYSECDNLPYCNDEMDSGKYNQRNFSTPNYEYEETKRSYTDTYGNYDRHVSRRESSIGRSSYKSYKYDRRHSNDRSTSYGARDYRHETDSGQMYNDSSTRQNNRREHSVGRNLSDDKYTKSYKEKDYARANTLSVQSNAGRSFTIDTSVNTSFQENISKLKNDSKICIDFDDRRRRASSVGRHLVREPSSERASLENEDKMYLQESKNKFRRARSVGRESSESYSKRRFEEIKEELQSYKYVETKNNKDSPSSNQAFISDIRKKLNDRDPRLSRRDRQSLESNEKVDQPTKVSVNRRDIRDPRLQRGLNRDIQNKGKSIDESKKQGIVYSNDNIAKGAILGSGYGVKNYKIPKIKRVQEEACPKDVMVDVRDVNETDIIDKKISTKKQNSRDETNSLKHVEHKDKVEGDATSVQQEKVLAKSEINDDIHENDKNVKVGEKVSVEKRVTRSSTKSSGNEILNELDSDIKPLSRKKRNRIRKTFQYESDSDDDNILVIDTQGSKQCPIENSHDKVARLDDKITCNDWDNIKPTGNMENSQDSASTGKLHELEETKVSESVISAEDLSTFMPDADNCFGIDLEMFPDSLATDPVIENINELIADLDDDLDTSKNDGNKGQFTKEIILENMLENITCTEKQACENSDYDNEKNVELNKSGINVNEEGTPIIKPNNIEEVDSNSGEVSTTETEKKCISPQKKLTKCYDDDDICSTPDSTINVNENVQENSRQEKLPDSTDTIPCEMSSDITSTEVKDTPQLNTSHSDTNTQSDSIGSLLSILKDKSKIQELLTIIKDQATGNEKLKRKLEMLSEIVSDDEDISNSSKTLTSTTDENNEKAVVEAPVLSNHTLSDKHCDENIDNKTLDMSTDALPHKSVEIDSTTEINQGPGSSNTAETESKDYDEKVKQNIEHDVNDALQESIGDNDDEEIKDAAVESELSKNDEKAEVKITKPNKKQKGKMKNIKVNAQKPSTRSSGTLKIDKPPNVKKPSRELKQLQNDIKEMFLNEDVLNSSGIRMCRLAKLVEDRSSLEKSDQNVENSPVVMIQKIKHTSEETFLKGKTCKKKQVLKTKGPIKQSPMNLEINEELTTESKLSTKYKPGPKSKTKVSERTDADPYKFESDSIVESNDTNSSEKQFESCSESECGSLTSSQSSESNEQLVEIKKKVKRRRRGWQSGVIKPKNKKRKTEVNLSEEENSSESFTESCPNVIIDETCFTDKNYCFSKNIANYSCRLCPYVGKKIVDHHKKQHPHSEIPLSRMSPDIAKEAIEQSEELNFQIISKLPFDKYVCRFCFEEFSKRKTVLESFFWHVVSKHTGEYKQFCSECTNKKQCPFNLDIPPPPKEPKGQLIGYICGKCNFTQISLENLKTHVINRHNDEETEVYTINLSVMSKKSMSLLTKTTTGSESRKLRSSRGGPKVAEVSDETQQSFETDNTNSESYTEKLDNQVNNNTKLDTTQRNEIRKQMKSQIYFENEDVTKDICDLSKVANIKIEPEQDDDTDNVSHLCELFDIVDDVQGQEPLADGVDSNEQLVEGADSDEQSQLIDDREINREEHGQLMEDVVTEEQGQLMEDVVTEEQQQLVDALEQEALADDGDACSAASNDVLDYPHFKVNYTLAGTKEYVCCINGADNHYRTALLISFKKHVQLKHTEIWDGFCFLCKLIVTPQGKHLFKDCLQHFLDKHIDNFPLLENEDNPSDIDVNIVSQTGKAGEHIPSNTHLNVRPLSELMRPSESPPQTTLPVIESVVSLGAASAGAHSTPQPGIAHSFQLNTKQNVFKYEEAQTEVMDKKNKVVLEVMMDREKLVHIFKCAGRFCSYSTDEPADALRHAMTHERAGGQRALDCIYCEFDSSQSAVDLVTHVFKAHGGCRFACGHCFYRAAAAQLVRAHALRLHPALGAHAAVLRSTAPPRAPSDLSAATDILARETAVPYYVCVQPGGCRFRTYTSGKFSEHLQLRHAPDTTFLCSVCARGLAQPAELVQHMKVHGYRFYQCTWCVHGADDEAGLLAHAARAHPARPPQAYLRLITNKEGNAGFRVLPLAQLNVSKIATIDVTPSAANKDPAREAERSIDLEKLIGQTTEMIESLAEPAATAAPPVPAAPPADLVDSSEPFDTELFTESKSASLANLQTTIDNQIADAAFVAPGSAPHEQAAPAPAPAPAPPHRLTDNTSSDVICLDSDDDHCGDGPHLPGNETEPPKEVDKSVLFKCGLCPDFTFKSAFLMKRHILAVHPACDRLPCAHCPARLPPAALPDHCRTAHAPRRPPALCRLCGARFPAPALLRRHLLAVHPPPKRRKPAKRPPPADPPHHPHPPHPPAKLRRFGPGDVHRLPIHPILEELVYCAECEYSTKVRLNMARHLQLHAARQPAPSTAPVNPVPHLETNEKHFDKMVNLAASSLAAPRPDRPSHTYHPYPPYVSERTRYTCGAPACCYISLSEDMLKHHWEALHGAADFRCPHCAPAPRLARPAAARVLDHVRLHADKLYACPLCAFCHHRRAAVDRHLADRHPAAAPAPAAIVVREHPPAPAPAPPAPSAAPTMDLKPWQCGLCRFRSMLRPEVVAHCAAEHGCKMQYKCFHCAFRTSTLENATKHRAKFHPDTDDEIFYVYYREGAPPDPPDGTPRWRHQRLRLAPHAATVKTEAEDGTRPRTPPAPAAPPAPPAPAAPSVDLNIVKREPEAGEGEDEGEAQELYERFGRPCSPAGLRYKCPLCGDAAGDTRDRMQAHLYEELQCRKWGCVFCSYKAFHKEGLADHMAIEHRRTRDAIELPVDPRIETWITRVLDHQFLAIERNRMNSTTQPSGEASASAPAAPPPLAGPASAPASFPDSIPAANEYAVEDLEKAFGKFGAPKDGSFCCPKCGALEKEEKAMREHLETELNKIRWCCSACADNFQNYHEAQFHCKTAHHQQTARALEAPRDPALRSAWLVAAVAAQARAVRPAARPATHPAPHPAHDDNSLLEVRYEEHVAPPDLRAQPPPQHQPQPQAPPRDSDSDDDDDKLVIDEPPPAPRSHPATPASAIPAAPTAPTPLVCPFCAARLAGAKELRAHVAQHDDIKPYFCSRCDFNGYRKGVLKHLRDHHADLPARMLTRHQRAAGPPLAAPARLVCMTCEQPLAERDAHAHEHDGAAPPLAREGDIVVKCCACLSLHKDIAALTAHHDAAHPHAPPTYVYHKLLHPKKNLFCVHCMRQFKYLHHLRAHTEAAHGDVAPAPAPAPTPTVLSPPPPSRRCARKSTAKLPRQAVAKKSTAKLSSCNETRAEGEEYSFYGTRPRTQGLAAVTTRLRLGTAEVALSLRQLRDLMSVSPVVRLRDLARPDPDPGPRPDTDTQL